MLWIALEWYIWGFVALSNIFFVLGIVEVVCAYTYSTPGITNVTIRPATPTTRP